MKFKEILVGIMTGSMLASCHGDLDVDITSAITSTNMWTEEGDATAAMYGLYYEMRQAFNYRYLTWGDLRNGLWGDGYGSETTRVQLYQNQLSSDLSGADWSYIYTTINQANIILKHVPDMDISDEDTKNEILANAYFVRAFCYYWIARIWGDAPIVLVGYESMDEDLYPSRDPVEDVFDQVGSDIDQALAYMPSSVTERNTASEATIQMLKADYNLWLYKVRDGGSTALSDAETAVQAVLDNSSYSLEDNYADVFDIDNELGDEIIFAWSMVQDEYEDGYPEYFLMISSYVPEDLWENPVKVGSSGQWSMYTDEYIELLTENENDQRAIVNYESYYSEDDETTWQWINKFAGTWSDDTRIFDSDIVVYRFAEAYLFDAEIKMEQGDISGAVASLNKIAERAYGESDYYSTSMSLSDLSDAILTERMKEFPAEGKLWWDFIRMGVVFEMNEYLTGREDEENVLLWPVSQDALDTNPNITQTSGYDE